MNGYQLIDDYAGQTGVSTGGGTGQPVSPIFQAQTLAGAQQVAQIWATTFNRACRLVPLTGSPPWTSIFTPGGAGTSLSNSPSGITF